MTMLYKKVVTTTRPAVTVPFPFDGFTASQVATVKKYAAVRLADAGFCGGRLTRSDDNQTDTKVELWESKEAYEAFLAANKTVYDKQRADFQDYIAANDITSVTDLFELDEDLLTDTDKEILAKKAFMRAE